MWCAVFSYMKLLDVDVGVCDVMGLNKNSVVGTVGYRPKQKLWLSADLHTPSVHSKHFCM